MSTAKKWKTVRRYSSQKKEAEAREYVRTELERMGFGQLREARKKTQVEIASTLGIPQSNVSRIEKQTDLYVSSLRRFVEATGGDLRISAVYPEGEIVIDHFGATDKG